MGGEMRRKTDHLTFFEALAGRPQAFDFMQAMRLLESTHESLPRVGEAIKPSDEAIRLGQEPALDFAPATLTKFEPARHATRPKLLTRFFGFFGPNGALPLHLTEYARDALAPLPERYQLYARRKNSQHTQSRPSAAPFAAFLDIFHHRFLSLFYRAWRVAQPSVQMDRPSSDRFADYAGALFGVSTPGLQSADTLLRTERLGAAGHLVRHVRNADGLEAILRDYFALPVRVEQYAAAWLNLPESERTRLGTGSQLRRLGMDTSIGRRVWDRQHRIRLHFGPLSLREYVAWLPSHREGLTRMTKLRDWLRTYLCFEFAWDIRLSLKHEAIPQGLKLSRSRRLGWTTWLGQRNDGLDANDLVLDVEKHLARRLPAPRIASTPSATLMAA